MTSTLDWRRTHTVCERCSGLSNDNMTTRYTRQQTEPGAMTVALFVYKKGRMNGGGAGLWDPKDPMENWLL